MTALTPPWRVRIGRLSIEWAVAAGLGAWDEQLTPATSPRDRLLTVPVEAVAAHLAEGAPALLDGRPRRSAARGTPPMYGAAWRARMDVWMRELSA